MSENTMMTVRHKRTAHDQEQVRPLVERTGPEYETASRRVSDWANLSPVCKHPRCRRARRCNGDFGGDGLFCFRGARGEVRFWLEKICELVAEGRSIDEAKDVAVQAVLVSRRNRETQELDDGIRALSRDILRQLRSV